MLAFLTGRLRNTFMESLGDTRPVLDEQFDALSHVARRHLLVALLGENPQTTIPKTDGSGDDESFERRVAMRHSHLPRLEDRGFIRWDQENSRATKGPQFETIEPLLTLLDDHRDGLPGNRL